MLGKYKLREIGEGWIEFQSDDGKNDLLVRELKKDDDADAFYPVKADYLVELNWDNKASRRYAVRCHRVNISMVSPAERDYVELRRLAVIDLIRLVDAEINLRNFSIPDHDHDPETIGIHFQLGESRVFEQLSQARRWIRARGAVWKGFVPFQVFHELNPA